MALRFTLQLVVANDDEPEVTHELGVLDKDLDGMEQLGLTLAEAKQLLRTLQRQVVERQAAAFLAARAGCPTCGRVRGTKDHKAITVRTLFGTRTLASPRLRHCPCQGQRGQRPAAATFSPLAAVLPERTTPELRYLETKWASLVSYGLTVKALQDFLPVDEALSRVTGRTHLLTVAERAEQALGPEQGAFIDGYPAEWEDLPLPDGPLVVGLDGGYVRAQQKTGAFAVITGKSTLTFRRDAPEGPPPTTKCFGFVQTYDTRPKRRVFEVLKAQGMQMNPQAEHLLDWFLVTMRLTVLHQMAKGLRSRAQPALAAAVATEVKRLKWFLWHGNVFRALQVVEDLELDLDVDGASPEQWKLLKAVRECRVSIERNGGSIPNDGERSRQGEAISSAAAESTVNQVISRRFVNKQQRQWTTAWGAPAPADADPRAERRTRRDIPGLVSRLRRGRPRGRGGAAPRRVAPTSLRSPTRTRPWAHRGPQSAMRASPSGRTSDRLPRPPAVWATLRGLGHAGGRAETLRPPHHTAPWAALPPRPRYPAVKLREADGSRRLPTAT